MRKFEARARIVADVKLEVREMLEELSYNTGKTRKELIEEMVVDYYKKFNEED